MSLHFAIRNSAVRTLCDGPQAVLPKNFVRLMEQIRQVAEIVGHRVTLWGREDAESGRPVVGGWATGSFDPKRNKLTIRQRDVQRFAINVSRIPINWARLVAIGINGRNSELRKRDYSILHFVRDQHGQWVVVEP